MNIVQQYIPKSRTKQRPGYSMKPLYITVHSTGNPASTAKNEATYVCYNSDRTASFHAVVDDKGVYEVLPFNEVAWHAGDGGKGTGNRKSVGVEICESGDRKKAVDNAIEYIASLMKKLNIDMNHIRQHYDWTKKDCPRILRNKAYVKNGIDWNYFITNLKKAYEGVQPTVEDVVTQEEFEAMYKVWADKVRKKEPGEWSKDAREWAEKAGIIVGDETGDKHYKSFTTREELVQILYRAVEGA